MALGTSRIFALLLVASAASLYLVLSQGALSGNIGWTLSSGKNRRTGHNFWEKPGDSTLPVSVFTTALTAKKAEATKTKTQTRASTRTAEAETPMTILSKESFSKLPMWNFDDVYNQDAPPRHSACSQSLRNNKDESFRKAFLPNVRLFLHRENINMSEWNRLSHFNNPFGFMGFKYDEVMPSVKLIPKPSEPLLPPKTSSDGCVRCAVVGAAGILSSSKMGKEIDGHDYVFRVNGAVIKGYEEDVGSKTSVYVHTAHAITRSLPLLKKYGYTSAPTDEGIKYVLIPEGIGDFKWLEGLLKGENISGGQYHNIWPRSYYGGQYNESRFYVLHQDFLRYVRNRFLKSENLNASFWAIVRPTNGAFAVFLALHSCDVVSVYGFMTEDFKKYSNYYFERKVKTEVVFFLNHDYILEKNLWAKLHNSKVIRLYQRTETETVTEKPARR